MRFKREAGETHPWQYAGLFLVIFDKNECSLRDSFGLGTMPDQFEHLNNGVTILAERIDPKENRKAGKRLRLTGMSIINGAQTVASSASFVGANPTAAISAAFVHTTVIQADQDAEFSKRVTKARNLQNPVSAQNFAALDDQQERLRREMAVLGYHYVYKPEGLDGTADPKRIRIEEAAQALAIVQLDPRFPVYLKKEPGQLLLVEGAPYKALFTVDLTAYRLVNAVLFSRYLHQRMVMEAAARGAGYEKLTYKHGGYVTTQTLGIEQLQQLSEEVGSERSLLVLCSAFRANPDRWPNLTVKKIPNHIRSRCEWGHDDYSLNVENLPKAPPRPEAEATFPAKAGAAQPELFGAKNGGSR